MTRPLLTLAALLCKPRPAKEPEPWVILARMWGVDAPARLDSEAV